MPISHGKGEVRRPLSFPKKGALFSPSPLPANEKGTGLPPTRHRALLHSPAFCFLISNYEAGVRGCWSYSVCPGKCIASPPPPFFPPFPSKMLPEIYLQACKYRVNSFNLIYRATVGVYIGKRQIPSAASELKRGGWGESCSHSLDARATETFLRALHFPFLHWGLEEGGYLLFILCCLQDQGSKSTKLTL